MDNLYSAFFGHGPTVSRVNRRGVFCLRPKVKDSNTVPDPKTGDLDYTLFVFCSCF